MVVAQLYEGGVCIPYFYITWKRGKSQFQLWNWFGRIVKSLISHGVVLVLSALCVEMELHGGLHWEGQCLGC